MAIIHDVIPAFQLFQPASIDEALRLLDARSAGRVGAGGRHGLVRLAQGPHEAHQRGRRA